MISHSGYIAYLLSTSGIVIYTIILSMLCNIFLTLATSKRDTRNHLGYNFGNEFVFKIYNKRLVYDILPAHAVQT